MGGIWIIIIYIDYLKADFFFIADIIETFPNKGSNSVRATGISPELF